jgi:uncharacterized protein with PQ loop repeat
VNEWVEKLGMVAAITVPIFNIPLILRIIKRRSSEDISLVWVLGVWACFVLMLPSGLSTSDPVWKAFNIANIVFFTAVMVVAVRFHKPRSDGKGEA